MPANTWDPFRELDQMRREIDRVFDSYVSGPRWSQPFSRFSFLPGRAARAYPLMNVSEDADAVYIDALAPGIDPQSLQVQVVRGQLQVSGEKPLARDIKTEAYHRSERAAGKFVRTINLTTPIDEGKVKAEYRNGLLHITLAKAEAAKPRQITVNVG